MGLGEMLMVDAGFILETGCWCRVYVRGECMVQVYERGR